MKSNQKFELRIAVVDDSEFSRKSIIEILEGEGYNVVGQAGSAEEGISVGASTNANLYIIDAIMPERSGLEMAKVLTEKSVDANIVMISSLNMESIIIESISSGALDFIPKPFGADQLLKTIKKIELERNRG